jgi:hypothetical protein
VGVSGEVRPIRLPLVTVTRRPKAICLWLHMGRGKYQPFGRVGSTKGAKLQARRVRAHAAWCPFPKRLNVENAVETRTLDRP